MERELLGAGGTARPRRPVAAMLRHVVAAVAIAALVAVVASSIVLLLRFRPELQVDDASVAPAVGRYAPHTWVAVHELALGVALWATVCWAVLTAVAVRVRSLATTCVVMGAAVAAVGCAMVAQVSWALVRWDQLALWSVMSGRGGAFQGLWRPATSDEVRFLLVGGAEVGQGTYRVTLLVHLGAPVAVLLAMGVSMWAARRWSRPEAPGAQVERARTTA